MVSFLQFHMHKWIVMDSFSIQVMFVEQWRLPALDYYMHNVRREITLRQDDFDTPFDIHYRGYVELVRANVDEIEHRLM